MKKKKLRLGVWTLFLCLVVVSCMIASEQDEDIQKTPIQPSNTIDFRRTVLQTEITETKVPESTIVDVPLSFDTCKLGLGLREETKVFLLENTGNVALIMSASSNLAEAYFPLFDESIRVLGAPSLEVLGTKATRARDANLSYEALGYGLETSVSTPEEEWKDIIGSSEAAEVLVNEYEKQFLLAPGFKLMAQNEVLYAEMASIADIWVLQTQQLQKNHLDLNIARKSSELSG